MDLQKLTVALSTIKICVCFPNRKIPKLKYLLNVKLFLVRFLGFFFNLKQKCDFPIIATSLHMDFLVLLIQAGTLWVEYTAMTQTLKLLLKMWKCMLPVIFREEARQMKYTSCSQTKTRDLCISTLKRVQWPVLR